MEFQFINNIKKINYSTLGTIENVDFPIKYDSLIPNYLIKGLYYYKIEFINSGKMLTLDLFKASDFELVDLTILPRYINEKLYLPLIQFLKFEKNGSFKYPFTQITGTLANLAYYRTEQNDQFFILYSHEEGQERTPELFTLLIDRIWQVKFDHMEFLELVNSKP